MILAFQLEIEGHLGVEASGHFRLAMDRLDHDTDLLAGGRDVLQQILELLSIRQLLESEVQITRGLAPNERVIVSAIQQLSSGLPVRERAPS